MAKLRMSFKKYKERSNKTRRAWEALDCTDWAVDRMVFYVKDDEVEFEALNHKSFKTRKYSYPAVGFLTKKKK